MLARLANLGIRFPRRVLGLAGLVLVAAAIFGAPVSAHLSSGGFSDPGSPSSQADDLLASKFDAGDPNLILEVSSPDGVDSAGARAQGLELVHDLQGQRYASQITSYWTVPAGRSGALRSNDGRSALVVARIAGDDSTAPKRADAIIGPCRKFLMPNDVTACRRHRQHLQPGEQGHHRRPPAFRDDRHPAHGPGADLGDAAISIKDSSSPAKRWPGSSSVQCRNTNRGCDTNGVPGPPPTQPNVIKIVGFIGPVPIRLSILGLNLKGGIVATQADLDNLHALAEKLKTIDKPQGASKP